jgi:acyl carrier protein
MEDSEILATLLSVARRVLDDDEISFVRGTDLKDIPEWDSLSHVRMVVAMERAFGIRFAQSDFSAPTSIGDLVDLISRKRAG